MDIAGIIQSVTSDVDRVRLSHLPCAEDFYGTLLQMIPFAPDEKITIADLGSADGFVSALLLARYADAHVTMIDVNEDRLQASTGRFSGRPENFSVLNEDYARSDPPERYNLVVSSLSIHHLNDIDKRALYRTLYSRLYPGGVFINADRFKAPTELLDEEYHRNWQEKARLAGASEESIALSLEHMSEDHDAEAEEQIEWIRNAGFRNADIYYKNQMFAVIGGRRPDF